MPLPLFNQDPLLKKQNINKDTNLLSFMKIEIPEIQLIDMGFEKISPHLFRKNMEDGSTLYRDYREPTPVTYSYKSGIRNDHRKYNEAQAITKIEAAMKGLNKQEIIR